MTLTPDDKIKLPEPLILVGDNSLPNFTGKLPVDVGSDKSHVDAFKKSVPLIGGEEIKPISCFPHKANRTGHE